MNTAKQPPQPPDPLDALEFEPVSVDAARAALNEMPDGVEQMLDRVPGYWPKIRRAPTASDRGLTGAAIDWLAQLPPGVHPQAVCERYPRIVNAIAQAWPHPEARAQMFDHLLNDRRTGRRGFPIDVEREISALCLFASGLS